MIARRYWWGLPPAAVICAAAVVAYFVARGPVEQEHQSYTIPGILEAIKVGDKAKRDVALAELHEKHVAVAQLIRAIGTTTPERMAALELAAHSDIPEIARALEGAAASDSSPAVRAAAVSALGKKGGNQLACVIRATGDPDAGVRRAAAYSLSEHNGREAIEALVGCLEDEDSLVRKVAANALKKKTSEDFGFKYFAPQGEREEAVKKWKEWIAERL